MVQVSVEIVYSSMHSVTQTLTYVSRIRTAHIPSTCTYAGATSWINSSYSDRQRYPDSDTDIVHSTTLLFSELVACSIIADNAVYRRMSTSTI